MKLNWITVIGAIGATLGVVAPQIVDINPLWGSILTIAGLMLTTFSGQMIKLTKPEDDAKE